MQPLEISPRFQNTPEKPHITLVWGVPEAQYAGSLGLITTVYFQAECWSDRIQAVRCTLQAGIPFELVIPHCTISWADDVKPKESAEMLQRLHQSTDLDQLVPCMIKWIPLEDSISAYRSKVLALMRQGVSCNESCKQLRLKDSTLRSWFKRLPEDHPQRLEYKKFASKNMGGWKLGRKRKSKGSQPTIG